MQTGYTLKNNGAMPGSRHNVYAVIEYSLDGQHGMVVLEQAVAVANAIPGKKRLLIISSAGFIALVFIFVLLFEFRTDAGAA